MAKLTDDEQRGIIAARLSKTLSSTDAELRADRDKALDFYYGRPMGNELEGRAQVVSKDLMDTVEWIMPSLMRVFCTMTAIQFDPVGPEDEDEAKQETAYVRHVLWKKNPGFMILYCWLKDALLQKVGYVKYWWQEEEKQSFDEYTGLSDDQLAQTMQELEQKGEVEVVGQEQDEGDKTWSVKLRIRERYGCAKVDCFPPEEIIVDSACKGSIKTAKFVGHLRRNVTRSELIEAGYSRDRIKNLTSYDWQNDLSSKRARDTVNESINDDASNADWATQELTLLDCHSYVDADDDGIAELRHYLLAGNETLENEEAPEIPYESWTPIPVPHRHAGLSMYDIMEDLQRIHTALKRGLLDNIYFTMNPRQVYDKNTVDVATLQINRPGGHIANDGPVLGATAPIQYPPMAGQILPVIDYFDQVKETRTGVGRMSVGVDADVLAQSTKGAYMDAKGAANQRIEAICRIFAETGYSSLFSSIHRLLLRHQDWETEEKLNDKWVKVSPTEWRDRTNLTVSVGLGNASKDEIRQNLMLMGQGQQQAAQVPGLIQPANVYALFRRMQVELGFENDAFITDPKSDEYKQFTQSQQGKQDPLTESTQIQADANLKGKQLDAQVKARGQDIQAAVDIATLEVQSHVDVAETGVGAELKHLELAQRGAEAAASRDSAAAAQQSGAPGGVPGGGG